MMMSFMAARSEVDGLYVSLLTRLMARVTWTYAVISASNVDGMLQSDLRW